MPEKTSGLIWIQTGSKLFDTLMVLKNPASSIQRVNYGTTIKSEGIIKAAD